MIPKTNITTFQLTFLLIHAQIGVGVLAMPHDVFKIAREDSWISILITGVIIQLLIFIYGALIKRFPNENLFGIARLLLGKKFGNVIIVLLSLIYISNVVLILVQFVYVLKAWMLPHTPAWVITGLMCFLAAFIVKENIQIIARFTVIASIIFIGFISAALYAFKFVKYSFILPVGINGVMPIIEGIPPSLYSFQGYELLLILYPFVQPTKKGIIPAATAANIFVTVFYLLFVVVTILFFTSKRLLMIPEPVLYLVKAYSFRMVERPDLLFTSMWIVFVATTLILIVFSSSLGFATLMNKTNIKMFAIIIASVSFIATLPIKDFHDIVLFYTINNRIILPVLWGIPILFLLISIIFNKKEEVENK